MEKVVKFIHPEKIYNENQVENLLISKRGKEARAYLDFLDLYPKKIKAIDLFLAAWEKSDATDIHHKFKEVFADNEKLIRCLRKLIVDVSRDKEITKSFLYKVLADKLKQIQIAEIAPESRKIYYKNFKSNLARINELFTALLTLLVEENRYLRKVGELKAIHDLRDHGEFFNLIYDEKMKKNEIQKDILILLRYFQGAAQRSEEEDLDAKLKRVRYVRLSANTKDVVKYYRGPFMQRFPPDERESLSVINECLADNTYILIAAKLDDEVVGGIIHCILEYEGVKVGILYWNSVVEGLRERGVKYVGSELANRAIKDITSRSSFTSPVKGIVGEINDPQKMTPKQIETDAMNPLKRIEFWGKFGFRKLFQGYIQLTTDPKVVAERCSLFLIPIAPAWRNGVSQEDLLKILKALAIEGCEYKEKFLEKYGPWLKMMAALEKSKFFPLT